MVLTSKSLEVLKRGATHYVEFMPLAKKVVTKYSVCPPDEAVGLTFDVAKSMYIGSQATKYRYIAAGALGVLLVQRFLKKAKEDEKDNG